MQSFRPALRLSIVANTDPRTGHATRFLSLQGPIPAKLFCTARSESIYWACELKTLGRHRQPCFRADGLRKIVGVAGPVCGHHERSFHGIRRGGLESMDEVFQIFHHVSLNSNNNLNLPFGTLNSNKTRFGTLWLEPKMWPGFLQWAILVYMIWFRPFWEHFDSKKRRPRI